MNKLPYIKRRLKRMFNEELLSDEGWNSYIDLLLSNLDTSFLKYCRLDGMPYHWDISDYYTRSVGEDGTITFSSSLFDVDVEGNLVTLSYPSKYKQVNGEKVEKDPNEILYLDYGDVEVAFSDNVVKFEVFLDGSWSLVYLKDLDTGSISGEDSYQLDGSIPFTLTFQDTVEGVVSGPSFELLYLPEQIDPASIQYFRKEMFKMFDENNPSTSPQSLYGVLAKTLSPLDFYIVFRSEEGIGSRQKSFSEYVTLFDVQRFEGVEAKGVPGHLTAVTASKVPIDALRDEFGAGSQVSDVIGYDKNYLVVEDNTINENLIALISDETPDPDSEVDIKVIPSTLRLPSHMDPVQLAPPTIGEVTATKNKTTSGFTFLITISGVDPNAIGARLGYYNKSGEKVLIAGPAPAGSYTVDVPEARAGDTYRIWAMCEAPEYNIYLDSSDATKNLEVPKVLLPPVLTASGSVGEVISIDVKWSSVESAQRYQVFYQKSGGSVSSLPATTALSSKITLDSVGTYSVYVEAQADGFPSAKSNVATVILESIKLKAPSIDWYFQEFPNTSLMVRGAENSNTFKYRIVSGASTSEWKDCSAGVNENVGEVKVGSNTIEVYAVGHAGYSDSDIVSKDLTAVKLASPVLDILVDDVSGVVTVSWEAVSGATSYFIKLDGQDYVETPDLVQTYNLSPGNYSFSIYAVGFQVFPSDVSTKSTIVVLSEFKISKDQIHFSQRSDSDSLDLTATGAYDSEWDASTESPVSSRSFRASVVPRSNTNPNVPVVGEVQVITNPESEFTIDVSECENPYTEKVTLCGYDSEGNLTILGSPESTNVKLRYGIVKNYAMLSGLLGKLKSVDLYILCSKAEAQRIYGDRFEEFEDALSEILEGSIPVGSDFTINYVNVLEDSVINLYDNYIGRPTSIRLNNEEYLEIRLSQRDSSQVIKVDSYPFNVEWDVM